MKEDTRSLDYSSYGLKPNNEEYTLIMKMVTEEPVNSVFLSTPGGSS